MTSEYAGESAKLFQTFDERFQDVKSEQREPNIFATRFNMKPPDSLQHEVIKMQSNAELKARHNSCLSSIKIDESAEDFP